MSQARQQIITIKVLPKISRSKGNRAMKLGQLIDYNMRIFLEKSYIKYGGKSSPRSFYKKFKTEDISGSIV